MALLFCGVAYYFYYSVQDRAAIHNRAQEKTGIEIGRNVIDDTLLEIRRDLAFVSENHALRSFLDQPISARIHDFEQDMLSLASTSRLYDQIRWLDETGMERVRVNFNNGNPAIVPVEALQNKRTRYYFPAAFKLEHGEIYISPLDLNVEHDQIEIPYKPMLRIATPVFDSHGNKRGIVMLNYFGAELLARLDKATVDIADHIMLLNQDGYWLKSPVPSENWGFMFGSDQLTLARRHPAAWQRILAEDSGQFEDAEGLWTFVSIYPELGMQNATKSNALAERRSFWKLVAHLPPYQLFGNHTLLKPILVVLAVSLLLQFIWSWKLTRIRRLRKEAQDQVLQTDIDLRIQAENALHAKESMLSESQRIAHVGSWQIYLPDKKVTWSEETYRIHGLSPETYKPDFESFYALIHADDRSTMRKWIDACLAGKHPDDLEYRIVLSDNSIRILSCCGDVQYDSANRPVHMIGTVQDVTQQKQNEIALRDSAARIHTILNTVVDGIITMDKRGIVETFNSAAERIFGYNADEVIGHNVNMLMPEPYHSQHDGYLEHYLAGGKAHIIGIGRIAEGKRKDGSLFPLDLAVSEVQLGEGRSFTGIVRDITERNQAEANLRIAAIAFESQEPMVITDADSVILQVNRAFTESTGYTAEEVIGQKMNLFKSGRHDKDFYTALWESIEHTGSWQGEIWDRRKNGEIYPKWLTITAVKRDDGVITHYVATHTDITERKASEEEIKHLAFYDSLTQLPNRRLLQKQLQHAINVERREGGNQLALLMLDLDRFKAVNDSLGHLAGDELLQQVATRITSRLRDVDMVARLGGDEFLVLLENIAHPNAAARVAEEIIADLSKPFQLIQSDDVRIGASIGISLYPQHGDSLEILLDHADAALYQAKDQGRGCFAYFSEDMTLAVRERIELESRLRRAIEQQELRVFYQPQIDISSGRIIGAEALVRWQDPNEGLIPPSDFIPIAEEAGLIVAIGKWVLRETCNQGRQWLADGLPPLTLAVNVSPHQFRRNDISALVATVLAETGFPARLLELEITESGLMLDQDNVMDILNSLRAQGICLAIDDFGTGYSSLANLKHFPLDALKIDKSFIVEIPHNKDDMEIAATIVAMGHTLGLKVLAEGVETPEQLEFLRKNGCDAYQGFIKSPPIPAKEFTELLRDQQRVGDEV
ncbi:MAG: bifunctional diguanylate cyclase/phosphodiesterase [Methylobacter sp.]